MRRFLFQCLAFVLLSTGVAVAEPLAAPEGEVVLTVTGEIAVTNAPQAATFDMQMLAALPVESFETTTIWTEGKNKFTGVPLSALLSVLGVTEGTIRATAINDYSVEIPVDAIAGKAPIVAYEMDGNPMPRRQKGPLWIVYPYDADATFRTELVYSRSIWQLDRLEIIR